MRLYRTKWYMTPSNLSVQQTQISIHLCCFKRDTSVILASQCLSSKPMSSGIMKYNVIIQWHVAVTPGYFHTGRAVSWVPWWNEIQETGILIWEMPLILYMTSKQVAQPLSLSSVICKVSLIKLAIIDTLWSLAN